MDATIQSLMLAYSYPDDDQLLSTYVPVKFGTIRVNPAGCNPMVNLSVESKLASHTGLGFSGDASLYTSNSPCAAIQMQQITLVPVEPPSADHDRQVFSQCHWVKTSLDGQAAAKGVSVGPDEEKELMALERMSTYWLRQFDTQVPAEHPVRNEFPHNYFLKYARYMTDLVRTGKHPWAKSEWANDSLDDMLKATASYVDRPDARMMHLVGEQLPRLINQETNMLEEFRIHDVLDDYYENSFGCMQSGRWMGRTVSQLSERYPHMDILEIGAGTGVATKRIFEEIGSNFRSYTFTDISSGFFENATEAFSEHRDHMIFKKLDCSKDPTTQGFREGAYDVVVVFLVLHATPDLIVTLRNIRKLLKPGGFLITTEGSSDGHARAGKGFIFGFLPGWWLGADTGRSISPFVSTEEWDRMLRQTGFGGVDVTAPGSFAEILGLSVFVAQAVDDRVSFLREPLGSTRFLKSSGVSSMKDLVVVGGKTAVTRPLIQAITSAIKDLSIQICETLDAVDYSTVSTNTTIVSLTDLDKPVFKDITPEEFASLKRTFGSVENILWVTKGRLHEDPFCNMTVGFAQTAVHELPSLRFQNVDIADIHTFDPQVLAKLILRFKAGTSIFESERKQVLWEFEPEILIDADGQELVPRLRPVAARNDRYNSTRRVVIQEVDISTHPAVLEKDLAGWSLKEISRWGIPAVDQSQIKLNVSHAIMSSLQTSHGNKFLVIGVELVSQKRYLTLIASLMPVVHVPIEFAVDCTMSTLTEPDLLTLLAAHITATAIVEPLARNIDLVVHNATKHIALSVTHLASKKNIYPRFLADSSLQYCPISWTRLPHYMTNTDIARIMPDRTACFVDLSMPESDNGPALISSLPRHCRVETVESLYSAVGSDRNPWPGPDLKELLSNALKFAQIQTEEGIEVLSEAVQLDDLITGPTPENPCTVVNWASSPVYPVKVSALGSIWCFKGDKTYWMCGLSGALGVSLCDWMIERGARYLVLTSRTPDFAPQWIQSHRKNGVCITIIPCDVTDELALRGAHRIICNTLPPIIGVLNGAMVLSDMSIGNMSFQQLTDVLRPKVNGSIYLDRIFHDANLDFFIFFSSLHYIIGNMGQSNCSAANAFICSLAAQRRRRGLAATALNVGTIIGAGYMERESRKEVGVADFQMKVMHLSEQDYHYLFAEAIDVGRPDCEDAAELTTGLSHIRASNDAAGPKWMSNPALTFFIVDQVESSAAKTGNMGSKLVLSVKDQLAACMSAEEVLAVVQRLFADQLRKILQMNTADDDMMALGSNNIGLDSLVSVDIRTWLLRNFEVSIPVLVIMSSDTMAELVDSVVTQIPPHLLPGISEDASTASEEAVAKSTASETPQTSDFKRDSIDSASSIDSIGYRSAESTSSCSTPHGTPPAGGMNLNESLGNLKPGALPVVTIEEVEIVGPNTAPWVDPS